LGRRVAFADRYRALVADDEQAARCVERKRARREPARVGVLNERRLACRLVDPEHRDLVARADARRAPIADVNELPVRVDVNGAGRLLLVVLVAVGKGAYAEERGWLQPLVGSSVDLKLILRLERQKHPRTRRMEVQMARTVAHAVLWRDGDLVRQHTGVVPEHLQRTWILAGRS